MEQEIRVPQEWTSTEDPAAGMKNGCSSTDDRSSLRSFRGLLSPEVASDTGLGGYISECTCMAVIKT